MKPSAPSIQKAKGARVVIPKKSSQSAETADDKQFKENMKRYEQDLTILSKKIADCQGETTPVPGLILPVQPESLFVNNLRNSVDKGSGSLGNENTLRLNMLERIMEKLSDLDRVILKKTDLGTTTATARPRRKSKDGSDLFSLPTHLLMVDRLLDVFTMSQRLQIIEKQRGSASSSGATSSSTTSKDMENKNTEIEKLKKQLADAETAKAKYKQFATDKDTEFETYKREQKKQKGHVTGNTGDISSKLTVIGDGKAIVSVEVDDQRAREISELKAMLEKSEQKVRDMEERIEIMAASEQNTLNGIVSMTFALSNAQDVPTPEKLGLKFQNEEAKQATDQLLTTVVGLVSSKSKAAVEQFNDILQENKLITLEFEAYKTTSQTDLSRKNAEILALQESLSKAYVANEQADNILQEAKDSAASSRKELIQDYEKKIQDFRADNAASGSLKRQLEKANTNLENLEKRCSTAETKNIEMNGSLECLKSDLTALEKMNQNLMETIKKMTNQASKTDFADTFEEVMREEMMAMKTAFEAKLKIARQQTEAMSKKRQSEISRIEGSRSSSGLR